MTTLQNHWQVFDTTEPLLVWHLLVPAPDDAVADAVVDEAIVGLKRAGLVRGAQRPLPSAATVMSGDPLPFSAMVTVRNGQGALTELEASDAGVVLRQMEGPALDPAYARRFAVTGRPFVAMWSVRAETTIEVLVGFFTTIAFDEQDPEVYAANQARVIRARDALQELAKTADGRLTAPIGLTRD